MRTILETQSGIFLTVAIILGFLPKTFAIVFILVGLTHPRNLSNIIGLFIFAYFSIQIDCKIR